MRAARHALDSIIARVEARTAKTALNSTTKSPRKNAPRIRPQRIARSFIPRFTLTVEVVMSNVQKWADEQSARLSDAQFGEVGDQVILGESSWQDFYDEPLTRDEKRALTRAFNARNASQ